MTDARASDPPARVLRWVAIGALGGLILGLMASLLIRPPVDDRQGLEIALSADGSVNAVFLGGAITDGAYATTEGSSYSQRVAYGLGVPVTIGRGDVRKSAIDEAIDTVSVPSKTNLVVVELGSTDLYVTKLTPEEFGAKFREFVDIVRLGAPDAALICLGTWAGAQNAEPYDKQISETCVAAGGAFVPLADIYQDNENHGPAGVAVFAGTSDDFHPNDAGHAAIAERVLANLTIEEQD